MRAHPSAADFPGPVPADAPRLERSFTIDTDVPRWHSTGLYAAPGELVTVTLPAEAATIGGFQVRVGAHTDGIWHRSEWKRVPEISRRFHVSAATTLVANAFGGLIYVEVPEDAGLGKIEIEIEGAVEAPLFVLGETDPAAWRNEIRHAPGPWAEIAGRNMIVTTDAREVRDLDDPAAVAETWDRVLDLSAELATWPSSARSSPERFVVDRQISYGYMHAGYPLMAHLDQQANLVNAEHLRTEGNWGFFHEVGHNHQSYDWTFDGAVEVTVNLFTLYVYEFLCGIPVAENYRGSAAFRAEQMARYDFGNPDFEQWKREPFLALVMYEQLQQAFGWDAYRRVFATYRALSDSERPKSDDDRRDQWLVRFSRTVGHNLGPFFELWGVPTSQEARESVADLPVWLPPDFPPGRGRPGPFPRPPAHPRAHDTGADATAADVFTAADGTGFRVETVVSGLKQPTSLDFAPDGRLFVTERGGRVWVLWPGQLRPELALAMRDATGRPETGLHDLTFDPEFSDNRFVYLLDVVDPSGAGPTGRLVRYREVGNTLAEAAVLLDDLPFAVPPASGRLRFGPDGFLYAVLSSVGDTEEAEDPASYAGKILRVHRDGLTPRANPWASPVFSTGHRHPAGFDWHPLTGVLWLAEGGDAGPDKVKRIAAGADYWWPVVEEVRTLPSAPPPVPSIAPSIGPAGASFYTGTTMAGFRNDLFVAALDGAHLRRIRFDPSNPNRILSSERLLDGRFGRLRDVVTGPDGGLYVVTSNRGGDGPSIVGDDEIIRLMPVHPARD